MWKNASLACSSLLATGCCWSVARLFNTATEQQSVQWANRKEHGRLNGCWWCVLSCNAWKQQYRDWEPPIRMVCIYLRSCQEAANCLGGPLRADLRQGAVIFYRGPLVLATSFDLTTEPAERPRWHHRVWRNVLKAKLIEKLKLHVDRWRNKGRYSMPTFNICFKKLLKRLTLRTLQKMNDTGFYIALGMPMLSLSVSVFCIASPKPG